METNMQFQKEAKVISANGEQIGQIDRVVLKPEDKTVTHIVVDTGSLFKKEEKVIPIRLVASATETQILLSDEARDLDALPPFEEMHLVETNEDMDKPHPSSADASTMIYGYPVAGVSAVPEVIDKVATKIEQNIPDGTVAMKEGAKVISAEGKRVGSVERVLAEVPTERITHLLVSTGIFTKEMKLIPVTWVNVMGENEIHLYVKKASVKKLPDISASLMG